MNKLSNVNCPGGMLYFDAETGIITGCNKYLTEGNVEIPDEIDGVAVIGIRHSSFHSCTSITSIELPETMKEIGENSFSDCSSLKEFIIPKGIKVVETGVFYRCHSLERIEIPMGVMDIQKSEIRL